MVWVVLSARAQALSFYLYLIEDARGCCLYVWLLTWSYNVNSWASTPLSFLNEEDGGSKALAILQQWMSSISHEPRIRREQLSTLSFQRQGKSQTYSESRKKNLKSYTKARPVMKSWELSDTNVWSTRKCPTTQMKTHPLRRLDSEGYVR